MTVAPYKRITRGCTVKYISSNEMLVVDMFVSLDKFLVTEELCLDKTKQVNPQRVGIRATNCHCVSVVAKRTRIPCCLALHHVSQTPQECQSPHCPEFALGKKSITLTTTLDLYNQGSQHYHIQTSIRSFLTNQKLRDLGYRFVVRGEAGYICTFHKHESTCKVQVL